jgi:hypothetical protein
MAAITLHEFAKTVEDPLRRGIIETLYEDEPIYGLFPFLSIAGLAYLSPASPSGTSTRRSRPQQAS